MRWLHLWNSRCMVKSSSRSNKTAMTTRIIIMIMMSTASKRIHRQVLRKGRNAMIIMMMMTKEVIEWQDHLHPHGLHNSGKIQCRKTLASYCLRSEIPSLTNLQKNGRNRTSIKKGIKMLKNQIPCLKNPMRTNLAIYPRGEAHHEPPKGSIKRQGQSR